MDRERKRDRERERERERERKRERERERERIELNEVYLSGYPPITNMKYEYKMNNANKFLQKRNNIFYTTHLALSPSPAVLFFSKIHRSKILQPK